IRRYNLEVDSDVVIGERIIKATDVLSETIHHFGLHVLGALEHDVLKEMSEATAACRVVFRTDVVPDLDCHGWAGRVLRAQDPHAVWQSAIVKLELRHPGLSDDWRGH